VHSRLASGNSQEEALEEIMNSQEKGVHTSKHQKKKSGAPHISEKTVNQLLVY